MTIIEIFKKKLDLVRQEPELLCNYRFDKNAKKSNHFERLKLNIALYNDLKQTDFEIVKFLFKEEQEWRKYGKDGEVDNLYFCAFILAHFNNPEIIWLFFETKHIDFDSGIGFDGEYLVFHGIEATYKYLKNIDHPDKQELLEYIGPAIDQCIFTQEDIDSWKEYKRNYFECFQYPVRDEVAFLYATKEKELFLEKLPCWVDAQSNWNYENLSLYSTYAKFAANKQMQIEAVKLSIESNDKKFLTEIYEHELAELYIDNNENENAFAILSQIPNRTNNTNIIRDCLEQLCRIILTGKQGTDPVIIRSYRIIKTQQKKYKTFSPYVDNLIREADQHILRSQIANTQYRSKQPWTIFKQLNNLTKTALTWLREMFQGNKQ